MSVEGFFLYKVCMIKVDSGVLINYVEILKEIIVKYLLVRIEVKVNICFIGFVSFSW